MRKLILLANRLDSLGLFSEASFIDLLVLAESLDVHDTGDALKILKLSLPTEQNKQRVVVLKPDDTNLDKIKKQYRDLSKKYHPDLNPGDKAAELEFKKINNAKQFLEKQIEAEKLSRSKQPEAKKPDEAMNAGTWVWLDKAGPAKQTFDEILAVWKQVGDLLKTRDDAPNSAKHFYKLVSDFKAAAEKNRWLASEKDFQAFLRQTSELQKNFAAALKKPEPKKEEPKKEEPKKETKLNLAEGAYRAKMQESSDIYKKIRDFLEKMKAAGKKSPLAETSMAIIKDFAAKAKENNWAVDKTEYDAYLEALAKQFGKLKVVYPGEFK